MSNHSECITNQLPPLDKVKVNRIQARMKEEFESGSVPPLDTGKFMAITQQIVFKEAGLTDPNDLDALMAAAPIIMRRMAELWNESFDLLAEKYGVTPYLVPIPVE